MSRFLDALHSGRVLLMDGAMGTELQRAGIKPGECYEYWNLTHPGEVWAIHQAYMNAGARCLLTNSFQSNRFALTRHGLGDEVAWINYEAVSLARSVAGPNVFILGSIGPMVGPYGVGEFNDVDAVGEVLPTLDDADGLLLETCSDPHGLAGLEPWLPRLRQEGVPVLLSFTYQRRPNGEPCTRSGDSPEACAARAQQLEVTALGVNCGQEIGKEEIIEILRRYRQVVDLPLFARPNAGTPVRRGDDWVYPQTPEAMAAWLPDLLGAGVAMVGGCCGTTPAHIAAFRPIVEQWNQQATISNDG